jgi:hypothetical protein
LSLPEFYKEIGRSGVEQLGPHRNGFASRSFASVNVALMATQTTKRLGAPNSGLPISRSLCEKISFAHRDPTSPR